MAEMLVFCEKDEVAFELLSKGKEFATELGLDLTAALLGEKVEGRAEEYFAYGAVKVYLGKAPALRHFEVEVYAQALHQVVQAQGPEVILIGSTRRGKEMAPRLAQKVGAGCITDAIGVRVEDGNLFADRYALGGNTVSTEIIKTPLKVIAVMPRTFEPGPREGRKGEIVKVDLALEEPRVRIVERREKGGEAVNIEDAEVLVCIGRGLEKREDLPLIQGLADALNGELGCSRSLSSDYQWLSEERMVGISGKKCSPRLHISVGISGQIQHAVGILGSRIVVAINKDKSAPIFKLADYGIVGDLYEVVPKLTEKLESLS
ncbi:MAG: electron transfer flavoprotein subunit alpha/FixB family protein [Anaerolineae bacterium]